MCTPDARPVEDPGRKCADRVHRINFTKIRKKPHKEEEITLKGLTRARIFLTFIY